MKLLRELGQRDVLEKSGNVRKHRFALFLCPVCGNEAERRKTDGLKQKRCCGGKSKISSKGTPIHNVYIGMMQRCKDKKSKSYKNYGGRGINIYKQWNNFDVFAKFLLSIGWKQGMQIDRKDNNGDYEPNNIIIVSPRENCQNKRNNKHTAENIINIKKDYVTTLMSHKEIAIKYNDSEGNIGNIINGKLWSNIETEYDEYIEAVTKAKKIIKGKIRDWWKIKNDL